MQMAGSTPKKEELKNLKRILDQEHEQAVTNKINSHDYIAKVQIRKFKRQKLLGLHQLEQRLLKEVSLNCSSFVLL